MQKKRIIGAVLLIVLVGLLYWQVLPKVSSADTYSSLTASLDRKKSDVTAMVVSATASSALVTMLPDDWATPIAQELAEVSKSFLIVLAVIYAEKYLMAILAKVSVMALLPIGFLFLYLYHCWFRNNVLRSTAFKLLALAVISATVVPLSVLVSNSIEDTFHDSIQSVSDTALKSEKALESANEEDEEAEDKRNIFQKAGDWISNTFTEITTGAQSLFNSAKTALASYIEMFAILLVIDCVIPILTLVLYGMVIKWLFSLHYTAVAIDEKVGYRRLKNGVRMRRSREGLERSTWYRE